MKMWKDDNQADTRKRIKLAGIHPDSNGWQKWVYALPTRQMAAIYNDYERKGAFSEKKEKSKFRQMDIFEAARNMEREAKMEEQQLACSMEFVMSIDIAKPGESASHIQLDEMIDGRRYEIATWKGKEADQLYLDLVDRIITDKEGE